MRAALLLLGAALGLDVPHSADVSFYDEAGNYQSYQLGYYIAPEEVDTGFSFGVEVYNVSLADCLPRLENVDDDYFAAYVLVPAECAVAEVIYELESHGADFVFVDAAQSGLGPADTFNKYAEPVFFLDATVVRNLFQFSPEIVHRYVTVYLREEPVREEIAQLQLFYEADFAQLAGYLAVVGEVWERLGEKTTFEPVLVTFSSRQPELVAEHCIANGTHCALPPVGRAGVSGRAVVEESLRQICAAKLSTRQYFQYMGYFLRMCGEKFTAECSSAAALRAGLLPAQIAACVEESAPRAGEPNPLLAAHRQRYKAMGLRQFPEIVINNDVYRGTLARFDLLLSVCAALDDSSPDCKEIGLEAANDLDVPSVLLSALLLFGLAVLLMAWLCKKIARERYMSELNRTISKYVAEYAEPGEEATNM